MKRIAIALCFLLVVAVAAYAMQPMAVIGGGSTCSVIDNFNGSVNGTNLEAHNTNWVDVGSATAEIQSNQATIESAGAVYPVYHWNEGKAASADGKVCALAAALGIGTNSYGCVDIRLTTNVAATRGGYSFCAFADNSQLFELDPVGSFDILDTDLTAVADGSEICIKAQGNTVSGTVDGTTVVSDNISDNNNPVTVAGYIGLELGSDSDGTDIRLDDFKLCDTTITPEAAPLFAGDLSQFIQPTHGLRAINATNSLYPWAWRGLVAAYSTGLGNTGLTLRDVSKFRRDGTISGATWTGSKYGIALNFNGSSDFVSTVRVASFPFSIVVYIRTDNTDDTFRTIYGAGNTGQNAPFVVLGLTRFTTDGPYARFVLEHNVVDGTAPSIGSTTNVQDGNWHQIIGVAYAQNSFELFVDGKSEATSTNDIGGFPSMNVANIGKLERETSTQFYPGDFAALTIHNRPLRAAEIQQDYQNFKRQQTYLARR